MASLFATHLRVEKESIQGTAESKGYPPINPHPPEKSGEQTDRGAKK